jgi:hypothetical protein
MDDARRFYEDVYKAFKRLHYLVKGENLSFDPLAKGLSYATAVDWLFRSIKALLPRELDFNVDKGDDGYHLTIFKECDWPQEWLVFEVGPTVQKLRSTNPSLYRLFLSFIHSFGAGCCIEIWCAGMMGNSLEMLDDNIMQMEGDSSPEEIAEMKAEIESYRSGEPAAVARAIKSSRKMTAAELQRAAKRFKTAQPICNLIYQGAELLKAGCSLYSFLYHPIDYEDQGCYLHLLDQAAILWKVGDHLFHEHESCLEAEANEGIMYPTIWCHVDSRTKKIDLEGMVAKRSWPTELRNFFIRAQELIEKFNK